MASRTLVGESFGSLGPCPPPLPEAASPGRGGLVGLAPQESISSLCPRPPPPPEVGSPGRLVSRPDCILVGSLHCL